MLTEIKQALSEIKDEELKKKYIQIITTLLEKGYFPGLENIPVVKSSISNIDGEQGVLTFRGYPVEELANNCSYEDICFLLLKGDLPLKHEKENLQEKLLANKEITADIADTITSMSDDLHPMHMLSAGVLQLESSDQSTTNVGSYKQNLQRAIRLIAKLPTLIGVYRTNNPNFAAGKEFNSFAHYCLYCFNQELAKKEKWVSIFDKILMLHADHTINNSTFSVRAVGSSHASIYASIGSAINSLSGPLHGGANEKVIKMLNKIESPEEVADYIDQKINEGEKIMGIGHRVYKTYDPRAIYLKNNILPAIFNEDSEQVDEHLNNLYNIAQEMERVVLDRFSNKDIFPNVDFWSGLVLKALGVEREYFTTIFALGRVMGWTSHWVEHLEVNPKIYRPTQLYDGFNVRHVLRENEE